MAFEAEVGTAVADWDTLDSGAAFGTGLATAVGNFELKVGGAQFSIRTHVVDNAGSLIVDG